MNLKISNELISTVTKDEYESFVRKAKSYGLEGERASQFVKMQIVNANVDKIITKNNTRENSTQISRNEINNFLNKYCSAEEDKNADQEETAASPRDPEFISFVEGEEPDKNDLEALAPFVGENETILLYGSEEPYVEFICAAPKEIDLEDTNAILAALTMTLKRITTAAKWDGASGPETETAAYELLGAVRDGGSNKWPLGDGWTLSEDISWVKDIGTGKYAVF